MTAVAVGSLGGTITMAAGTDQRGARPTLSADDLLAAVPGAASLGTVETATLATRPSASLSVPDVLDALRWADDRVAAGAVGAVLVQGTDTLEEAAYLLDLHWDRPEPLVVTGAMRPATAAGADGPANVLAALQTAVAPASRSRGALVVMNDEVHAAARVRKAHASAPDAFRSPEAGPVGRVVEGGVGYSRGPDRWPALPAPRAEAGPRVALVEACLGDDAGLLRLATGGEYDGVVVAAFGAGHVSAEVADVIGRAAPRIPVVFATRTGAGTTLTDTYAFTGSESDLLARGAVGAGWLDPRKARLLLWSLLATGADADTVAGEFARRGGHPGGPHSA